MTSQGHKYEAGEPAGCMELSVLGLFSIVIASLFLTECTTGADRQPNTNAAGEVEIPGRHQAVF